MTAVLADLTAEAMAIVGAQHWPTGAAIAVHQTVRSLEDYRDPVPPDDPAVVRYAAAMRRTAARCEPVDFRLTGLTLTPTNVMCSAEPVGAAADDLAAALADELGPDGWHEADFDRDIWYLSLVHYTGPVAAGDELIDWVADRRDLGIGNSAAREVELMKWVYNGRQVVPVTLALAELR